jgi:NAD+--dinitrogen-reductase ADP-D-ribosyltransferase
MEASPYNLCSLPPWLIASSEYNLHPQPLEIQGVRSANRLLFERLDACDDPVRRAHLFHDYMDVRFQLHQWRQEASDNSRKSLKNSYLRFLKGWMFDANSVEGAVLKGWVESRIGLPPLFHRQPIDDPQGDTWRDYQLDRMRGAQRTSAILAQLDLLYEFVQDELRRRHPGVSHLTLYRGIHDFSEHRIVEQLDRRHFLLRLNNLNSFTDDFERAWEFGSRVLKTAVPLPKIFFRGDLFPSALLKGENEAMVIGGLFQVEVLSGG